MSHFTEIKTQIKDIEALRAACQEIGLTLLQNTEARGYYENKTKGDYVVQLKGPYDIALNQQPDGTFGLTADLWQGHVEEGGWQGIRQAPPALRRPQSYVGGEEEGVVRSSSPTTKRLPSNSCSWGCNYGPETKGRLSEKPLSLPSLQFGTH